MLNNSQATNSLVRPFILVVALLLYGFVVNKIDNIPRPSAKDELNVAIPPSVQIVLAGGDRYLAANLAVFRALVVGTEKLDQETYDVLGRVQSDAARLNPAHEDNYYISQAILPWNNQVEADIKVQQAATAARPWDAMPPFFLGFDKYYFLKDSVGGAESVRIAADRSPPGNRELLLSMAARWYEKGDDPAVAIGMIKAMAENTRDKELKKHLALRITRLDGLMQLRKAAAEFAKKNGHPPKNLNDLIGTDLLSAIPQDPLGSGYQINANGLPVIAAPARSK